MRYKDEMYCHSRAPQIPTDKNSTRAYFVKMKSTPFSQLPLSRVMCFLAHHLTKWNDFYIVVIWTVRQLTFSQLSIRSEGGGLFCHCHCNNEFHWLYCTALHGECIAFSMSFLSRSQIPLPHHPTCHSFGFTHNQFFGSSSNWKVIRPISFARTYAYIRFVCSFVHACTQCVQSVAF